MKKTALFILSICSIIGCVTEADKAYPRTGAENVFTTESAQKAIEIAEALASSDSVTEGQWGSLFSSAGYKNYLIYSDSAAKKIMIRNAIETVFDPKNKNKLDSLLSIPIQLDQNYFKLSLVRNFNELKNNLQNANEFLDTTDFSALITSGDSLAKTYLPKAIQDSLPELYDIHMIMTDPDAKVMDNAIVFDLNMSLESGKDGLVNIIAHEYHHNYRKLTAKSYNHPLMIQLNKIHQEGIADMIDKDEPPIGELGLFPASIIDAYNSDYENTPNNLKQLDAITNRYLMQEMDTAAYYDEVKNYFKFGGHTAGIYMAFKIAEDQGIERLIESYNDPVEFVKDYNHTAESSEDAHVFSMEFIRYIELLDEQGTNP